MYELLHECEPCVRLVTVIEVTGNRRRRNRKETDQPASEVEARGGRCCTGTAELQLSLQRVPRSATMSSTTLHLFVALAAIWLPAGGTASALTAASCGERLPPIDGYFCAAGFCGCEGPRRAPPTCVAAAELKLGGTTPAERVQYAKRWCDVNSTCTGFAIDPSFAITLAFTQKNLTTTAQPNAAWSIYWKGAPQPLPPIPPAPAPPPAWEPILPKGLCSSDEHCSLNGICAVGKCICTASWTGHNCQHLALRPVPKIAGYGWNPNVTSWGGSIYHNASDSRGLYHLYVTEETDGKGLYSWISNSQIIHAVATTPFGPYRRKDVVSTPPTTNPQVLHDPTTGMKRTDPESR